MIILGWLLTLGGGIGTIISQIMYTEAKKRHYGGVWGSSNDMDETLIATYVCIGIAVLGIVLLIIGYISKTNQANNNSRNMQPSQFVSSKIICPVCYYENNSDAMFCNSCGNKLKGTAKCPKCNTENSINSKFCKRCGNSLK